MERKRKKLSAPLKILLIITVLLAAAGGGYFAKAKYEQSKMLPVNTQEIIPGIFAVKNDFVNFYLVKTGESYIAIDAGANASNASKELQNLGISSDDIAAIFLTHSHYDHTAALKLFTNAATYTGSGPSGRIMSDDEIVELSGVQIKCIYTPGHTSGSVCYLINDKYLFTGDTLSLNNGKVGLFNSFFNKDDRLQQESIEKLARIDGVQYIFSGHYGFTDNAVFSTDME